MESSLVLHESLKECFKVLVDETIRRQHVSLEEVTEFYLVNLLTEYARAENLFTVEAEGRRQAEPLAFLYYRALQQERDEKIRTFRRLGDVSLYTAGFFQQSLKDRSVGPDYYLQMGKTAYEAVAHLSGPTAFAFVYQELCFKFTALVDILEEIAARGLCASGLQGQMQVFEGWNSTGNERLQQVLLEIGMIQSSTKLTH